MFEKYLKNLTIRTKLIILFVGIKIIPILLISLIALYGLDTLHSFIVVSSKEIKQTAKEIVESTTKSAMQNSIEALDKRTQTSLEILTAQLAQNVANFLYERDDDIRFLASIKPTRYEYNAFLDAKLRDIANINFKDFVYDEKDAKWIRSRSDTSDIVYEKANLKDNAKEFHRVDTNIYPTRKIPIYKEITFFNLNGQEEIKISSIDMLKRDISKQENTYLKAEDYFRHVLELKKDEIYVSDVIGEYVPTRIIGTFTKEKASKAGIAFEPEKYAYAGIENPKGKMFEGIIRFVTPVYRGQKKIGFVSLALDHRHVMEFTDTINPLNYSKTDIPDASSGNYSFMWDYKGRNISHPRDYFIVGFDKNTGKRVPPWISKDVQEKFEASSFKDLNSFLAQYPEYENQSLGKKPNLSQIQNGQLALDCRFLNFAPQCEGWMQLTENGGVGSFVIFWSNVWKLTTAAVIPYHTGQYGSTQRGFGFVTLGANVKEFHKAANQIKDDLDNILDTKLKEMDKIIETTKVNVDSEVNTILDELTYITIVMIILIIIVAIWLSNLLKRRLDKLLKGAKEFSKNNFTYRITEVSKDELGELSSAFNEMSASLEEYISKEKELKLSLEEKVLERTQQLSLLNDKIQNELELKVKQEEKLEIFAKIFSNTIEAIVITDVKGTIMQINRAFTQITKYTEDDIIGSSINRLRSHRHDDKYFEDMWKTIMSRNIWEGEIWNYKKDGTLYPALISIIPILNKSGDITNFVAIQHDITDIKQNEEELHYQAHYDSLTKLANRSLGYERLKHAIEKAQIADKKVAVLFLDLDKFKNINDTMGHDIGDLLLIEVANRLKKSCSSSDTVCRLGGDEFLIVLEDISSYEDTIAIIEKIIHEISTPFHLGSNLINTSTSIGVTFYPDDGKEYKKLLKNADVAMYRAKSIGRNTFEIYTKELNQQFKEAVKLEDEIRAGIKNSEFYMVFQPIYNLSLQETVGFEALMRWKRNGVECSPNIFMDVLESTRLIADVTFDILYDTLKNIEQINERFNKDYFISINISSVQFSLPNFNEEFLKIVQKTNIKPENICLEVTESIFLNDINDVSQKLQEMKKLGFTIALDDFGTGYSSLQYIKSLPIDKIKLDQSFVRGLPHSKGDKAIIHSICSLAHDLSLQLVAEGVETIEQSSYLEAISCKFAQGYLFSKPKNKQEIMEFLDSKILRY